MNLFRYQVPLFLWATVVYFLSAFPNLYMVLHLPLGIEKVVHAFLFLVLCWLAWRLFYNQEGFQMMRNSALLGAFVFCVVFGVLDEYHHNFVSGRSADPFNVVANIGGALLFVAIAVLLRRDGDKSEKSSKS